jgi:hypothetical protein
MKRIDLVSLAAALWIVACGSTAVALPPPPTAPFTLWNFLGIPQGFNKIRDATSNKRGNFPGMERKPPLMALADPKNLNSPVSAIKKAAEIKTEEDMAPQKIKAVKYLATVGCGCYGGVKEALLESLDDCTEEVRYQTVLAIQDAASLHCETCNRDCCCDEELSKKLAELAYEKNDKGCWLEPSERVREAAKQAMRACCPGQGPIGETEPGPPPTPPEETIPAPPEVPAEVIPEADRSAHHLPPPAANGPVQAARTKVMLPHGTTAGSEAVVTEEIVTVDFGNQSSSPVVSTRRSTTPPGTSGKTTPASTRRKKPSGTHSGPSSRRTAAERGLSSRSPAERTAQAQQPTAATGDKEAQPTADEARASNPADSDNVVFVSDQPAPNAALAPRSGPPLLKEDQNTAGRLRHPVRGTVTRISRDAGVVEVRIDKPGEQLSAGDRLKVTHEHLLDEGVVLGYLEVVSAGPRGIMARPLGSLKLDQLSRGDQASFEPARERATATRSASAVRLPAVTAGAIAGR